MIPYEKFTLKIDRYGILPYLDGWAKQKQLAQSLSQSKKPIIHLMLLEHPPTYTLGRRADKKNLLWSEEKRAEESISVHQINRGGDVTYHGPGQLVGYFIFNLQQLQRNRLDLPVYLRTLEQILIETIASFGLNGERLPNYTGVWLPTSNASYAKIAAIGIHLNSEYITTHGFALNINPNLTHFNGIIPCGIDQYSITSISQQTGTVWTTEQLIPTLIKQIEQTSFFNLI